MNGGTLPTPMAVTRMFFLTDEELADLQVSFPAVWEQYIEKLSEYMASTGKRYQSHAATIRRWAGEDAKKCCHTLTQPGLQRKGG